MDTGSEGKDEIKTHYVSAINRHDKVGSCKFGEKQQDGKKKSTPTTTININRASSRFLA